MPTLFRAELRGGQAVGQPRLLRVGVRLGLCLVIGLFVACHREEDQSSTDSTAVNRAAYGSRGSPGTNSADARAIAQFKIRHYQLKLSASDLAALQSDSFSNDSHPASFIADGKTYGRVKLRVRGSWSRSWPKKSLKIQFEHSDSFEGHHSLNLNSGWRDPAFIREPLAYYVYTLCGAPASQARLVRLDINGDFGGLYVEVEQPDKVFLQRSGLVGASVYKAVSRSNDADERDVGSQEAFRGCYNKETQKNEGYEDLQEFCHQLRNTTNIVEFFETRVDLPCYVNYLAATILVQNWDGYNKNHFLVHDLRGSQKWFVIPWDLDRTLGDHWNGRFDEAGLPVLLGTRQVPGVTGWNRLEDRFFNNPSLRARLFNRLSELLNSQFTEAQLYPLLDRIEKEIGGEVRKDRRKWPGAGQDVQSAVRQVKQYIKERRAFLLREMAALQATQPSH